MNEVTFSGNLTANPELRYTPTGAAVARFRIAHTPRSRGEDGNDLGIDSGGLVQLGVAP